jgi:hypothetical protein
LKAEPCCVRVIHSEDLSLQVLNVGGWIGPELFTINRP